MIFSKRFIASVSGSLTFLTISLAGVVHAAHKPALQYAGITSMQTFAKPSLPVIGKAGSSFQDPTFGSRLLRVTDPDTLTSAGPAQGASFGTPLYGEPNAWNADNSMFYVEGQGLLIPYHFDSSHFSISRLDDPAHPGETFALKAQEDATFSFKDPNILYFKEEEELKAYDFKAGHPRDLVNLTKLHPGSTKSLGPLSVSANEKLCVHWGGEKADSNFLVLVYDVEKQQTHLLDTDASVIDGRPLPPEQRIGGYVHYAWIDKSGDFVAVMSTAPYQIYIWDLALNSITKVDPAGRGRKALGYGWMINDGLLPPNFKGRWLIRPLKGKGLGHPKALMQFSEPFQYESNLSWNQVGRDHAAPVLMTTFHDEQRPVPWGPLADEIFALATDGSGHVWRFAHTRDSYKGDWLDQPKGNLSQDGRYFLFTSNWENTLGTGRRDAFLLELPLRNQ